MKQKKLEYGYSASFENVNKEKWYEIIDLFNDANLYQTWDYGKTRHGEKNLNHFILKSDDSVVAAAQVRIAKIKILNLGAAYIRWGPLWQVRGRVVDPTVFRIAIRALRNEYVVNRGLYLILYPVLFDADHSVLKEILIQEGFANIHGENPQQTLILNIESDEMEIRKNFEQKWRNCLNKAEKSNLEVLEGTTDVMFEEFIKIYRELIDRKKFKEPNDINQFRAIQRAIPEKYKMKIFIAQNKGKTSAGAISTAIGKTGVYLFGATNHLGMKDCGSYLLQWKMIQWMKNAGCAYYNLNGVNPLKNPGGYHFKAGVAGRNGKDVRYLGRFHSYSGSLSAILVYFAVFSMQAIKRLLVNLRKKR